MYLILENTSLIGSRIPQLDVIRCFATIQVVLFHLCASEAVFSNALALWGREGVGLFFAISGAGLINRYYHNIDYKAYYKKRFVSLYIPFWIGYIAVFMRNYFINGFHFPWEINGLSKKYMLLSVFGVDCFASTLGIPNFALIGEWFLAVILFIYMIFPLWRLLFKNFPTFTVSLFLVLRVIISIKNPFPQLAVCFNPITALSNFTIGAYLIYWYSKKPIKLKRTGSIIALAISVCFIILGKFFALKKGMPDIGEQFATFGVLTILIIATPLIYKYAKKFVTFICGISYEVFLMHHVVIYALTPAVHNNFTAANAVVGYVYILALILLYSYALKKVTSPIMNCLLKNRKDKNRK